MSTTIATTVLADNAYGTIASGLAVGDTTLSFTTGHGARFPVVASPNVMYCCLINSTNILEEIKITAHASGSDSATIVRAMGGTSAKAWSAGDRIEARLSSTVLARITGRVEVNVVTDFGATGLGVADDYPAFAAAVAYCKSFTTGGTGGGEYHYVINVPAGFYHIGTVIDCTLTNGIMIRGCGASYINTTLLGYTGTAPVIDFSGSSSSGFENLFIHSASDFGTPSLIGVLFGLVSTSGLNCFARNFFIDLPDSAGANGGLGSVGLINSQSEEFSYHNGRIRANTPVLASATTDASGVGGGTIASTLQTLVASGSMGVMICSGENSLVCVNGRGPALALSQCNTFKFDGYLGREGTTGGFGYAVRYYGGDNIEINSTVEVHDSFAFMAATCNNIRVNASMANCADVVPADNAVIVITTTPSFTLSNFNININLPNQAERQGKVGMTPSPQTVDTVLDAVLSNGVFTCPIEINSAPYNINMIQKGLLKVATNVICNSGDPFRKDGDKITMFGETVVSMGTIGSHAGPYTIRKFFSPNRSTTATGNGGYYRVTVEGSIFAGSATDTDVSELAFERTLVIGQKSDTTTTTAVVTTTPNTTCATNAAVATVTDVTIGCTLSAGVWSITLVPTAAGSGSATVLNFRGYVSVEAAFPVNGSPVYLA